MENIDYSILNGSEIDSDYILQYIVLNSSEYPKFTREVQFQSFKNFLNQDKKLKVVIAVSGDQLVGWLMISYAERLGKYHFNMLVQRDLQRRGIGSKLLTIGKELFTELYGVVVPVNRYKRRDGTQYQSPMEFYQKNGFLHTGKKFIEYKHVTMMEIKWSKR